MSVENWPVIILGGSGYVAGEMLRLVAGHLPVGVERWHAGREQLVRRRGR